MRRISFLLMLVFLPFVFVSAQTSAGNTDRAAAYTQAINSRAEKIVSTLGLDNSAKAERVKSIVANQYRALNVIQEKRDAEIKAAKASAGDNKDALKVQVKGYEDAASAEVDKLHAKYVSDLSKELTAAQIDKVKDGMTYNVTPITYTGYLAMIPTLTDKQKEQIMTWLVEAREHAIDAESSEKKHAWFGKYKGRINNYLSAQGIDMKKAGDEWQERIKASKAAKTVPAE